MKFYRCSSCSSEYVFNRAACQKCHSSRLEAFEVTEATALESIHLVATPEPYPEDYSVVMFEIGSGAKGFCRTTDAVRPGEKVKITVDEYGPVCRRSD